MKISKTSLLTVATAALVVSAVVALPALAASPDWEKPVTEGVTTLSTSVKNIAAPIIGLCIGIFGLWGCMSGRIDWSRIWLFIIGGMLIGGGPTFGPWIMDQFGS